MIGTANKIRTLNNIYEPMLCSDCVILIACYDYCDLLTAKIGTANKYTEIVYMMRIVCSDCCDLLTAKIGTAHEDTK